MYICRLKCVYHNRLAPQFDFAFLLLALYKFKNQFNNHFFSSSSAAAAFAVAFISHRLSAFVAIRVQ